VASLYIIIGSTARAAQFLSEQGSLAKVLVVEATEGAQSIVVVIVANEKDFVCGVEHLVIKCIAN
jgi:hypothetical protein